MPEDAVHFHHDRRAARSPKKQQQELLEPIHYPFWFGGSASCFAACVTHPLDLVKVRLQTQPHGQPRRNMVQMFLHIFHEHDVKGLYKGLSASILRQATYSTTRFGVYEVGLPASFPSSSSLPSEPKAKATRAQSLTPIR